MAHIVLPLDSVSVRPNRAELLLTLSTEVGTRTGTVRKQCWASAGYVVYHDILGMHMWQHADHMHKKLLEWSIATSILALCVRCVRRNTVFIFNFCRPDWSNKAFWSLYRCFSSKSSPEWPRYKEQTGNMTKRYSQSTSVGSLVVFSISSFILKFSVSVSIWVYICEYRYKAVLSQWSCFVTIEWTRDKTLIVWVSRSYGYVNKPLSRAVPLRISDQFVCCYNSLTPRQLICVWPCFGQHLQVISVTQCYLIHTIIPLVITA